MLGHRTYLKFKGKFDTYAAFRNFSHYKRYSIFEEKNVIDNFSTENIEHIKGTLSKIHPNCIINCIGITKQQKIADDPVQMITTNSLFPHILSSICEEADIKLIHISTDCVFSGEKGNYKEDDFSDAVDLYGRTKFLGEVRNMNNTLTIRTSIIGRELKTSLGLVEWFLNQKENMIKGFKNAVFSGFTTDALSDIFIDIIQNHSKISGLYNVSAEPINKFDLLNIIKNSFNVKTEIAAFDDFYCDRSLDSTKFRANTGFKPLLWQTMIDKLAIDTNQYNIWRNL